MTQGTLPLAAPVKVSLCDQLAAFLKDRPGVWVDGRELAKIAGAYAWRSRVSDCRRKHGMTIQNRERKVFQFTVSEYRYVPTE